MNAPPRTLQHAIQGYDEGHEARLVDAIGAAITVASKVDDADVIAFRTAETANALTSCLIATLSLCADLDDPARLRRVVDQLAKRIRKGVATARAEGAADRFGAGRPGGRV